MEETLEHRFAVRRITRSLDPDYQKGLRIYNSTTPNDIKTNTNEISKWLTENLAEETFDII